VSELRFSIEGTRREILDFYELAKGFLDPSAEACLNAFAAALANIRDGAALRNSPPEQTNRRYRWEIPEHMPLLTRPSRGYEKGKRSGGREVVGNITAVWEITPDTKESKRDVPKQFRLTGNASVLVQWIETEKHTTIGRWHVDVADSKAPGCMFHTQFPAVGLPVPRHPCIAFTPMAVTEHVLGELFQEAWEAHTRLGSPAMESWRGVQKRLLSRVLEWHQEVIDGCECPPWTALKTQRLVPADRLVADE
jgi:hypothetical protein